MYISNLNCTFASYDSLSFRTERSGVKNLEDTKQSEHVDVPEILRR